MIQLATPVEDPWGGLGVGRLPRRDRRRQGGGAEGRPRVGAPARLGRSRGVDEGLDVVAEHGAGGEGVVVPAIADHVGIGSVSVEGGGAGLDDGDPTDGLGPGGPASEHDPGNQAGGHDRHHGQHRRHTSHRHALSSNGGAAGISAGRRARRGPHQQSARPGPPLPQHRVIRRTAWSETIALGPGHGASPLRPGHGW